MDLLPYHATLSTADWFLRNDIEVKQMAFRVSTSHSCEASLGGNFLKLFYQLMHFTENCWIRQTLQQESTTKRLKELVIQALTS